MSDGENNNSNNKIENRERDETLELEQGANENDKMKIEFDPEDRETWDKKMDFLFSVIGFAVDLANVWRFPYLCFKNGGGAFLIPYILMLIFGGVPLFYMELALGQYVRKGSITCWGRICPLFKGIGYSMVMIAFYTDFFYNVIIAWSIYYLYASLSLILPWTICNNKWNTINCYDRHLQSGGYLSTFQTNLTRNFTIFNVSNPNSTFPADEYYNSHVLGKQAGNNFENLGAIQPHLAICLLLVYVICYFSLWKGISMSGKVVWFTALFPYVVLITMLFKVVFLEGSQDGIRLYIYPNITKLYNSEPWVDAATQVFFSLGPGFGVLLTFASYNKFNNNVFRDALITSAVNSATSFLSGFVVFSVIGFMAKRRGLNIQDVVHEDPGLVFSVYPEAFSTMFPPTFWSIMFFLMLLTLGLDSSFGGSESVITGLSDEFPILKRRREIFVLCLFIFYYCIGLTEVTNGGIYVFYFFERYCINYSLLLVVMCETICISWIYGVDKFRGNIKEMIGSEPNIYWKICWKFIAPIFIGFNIVFGLVNHSNLTMGGYVYPVWANVLGWMFAFSSVLFIPIVAIIQIIKTPGTLKERIQILIIPHSNNGRPIEYKTVDSMNFSDNKV
uniref:Transporter n=1 Tax=Schmidtea mediterranea TaxID=79327 RepID=A0A0H3YK07_SCHMD|nr:slc6a-3 [Schmidtea mediterranea]